MEALLKVYLEKFTLKTKMQGVCVPWERPYYTAFRKTYWELLRASQQCALARMWAGAQQTSRAASMLRSRPMEALLKVYLEKFTLKTKMQGVCVPWERPYYTAFRKTYWELLRASQQCALARMGVGAQHTSRAASVLRSRPMESLLKVHLEKFTLKTKMQGVCVPRERPYYTAFRKTYWELLRASQQCALARMGAGAQQTSRAESMLRSRPMEALLKVYLEKFTLKTKMQGVCVPWERPYYTAFRKTYWELLRASQQCALARMGAGAQQTSRAESMLRSRPMEALLKVYLEKFTLKTKMQGVCVPWERPYYTAFRKTYWELLRASQQCALARMGAGAQQTSRAESMLRSRPMEALLKVYLEKFTLKTKMQGVCVPWERPYYTAFRKTYWELLRASQQCALARMGAGAQQTSRAESMLRSRPMEALLKVYLEKFTLKTKMQGVCVPWERPYYTAFRKTYWELLRASQQCALARMGAGAQQTSRAASMLRSRPMEALLKVYLEKFTLKTKMQGVCVPWERPYYTAFRKTYWELLRASQQCALAR